MSDKNPAGLTEIMGNPISRDRTRGRRTGVKSQDVDRKTPGFESIDGFLAAAHDSPGDSVAKGAIGKVSAVVQKEKSEVLPNVNNEGARSARARLRAQGKPRFSLPGAAEDSGLSSVARHGIRADIKTTTFSPSELSTVSTAPPTPAAVALGPLTNGEFDSPLLTQENITHHDEDEEGEEPELELQENSEEIHDDAEGEKKEQSQSDRSPKTPSTAIDSPSGTTNNGGQEIENNTPLLNSRAGLPSPGDDEQLASGNDVSDDDNDNRSGGFELAETNETPVRPKSAAHYSEESEEEMMEEPDPGPRNSAIDNITGDNDSQEEEEGDPKLVHDPETPKSVRDERLRKEEKKILKGRKKKPPKMSKGDSNYTSQDSVTPGSSAMSRKRKKKVKINAPGVKRYPAGPRDYSSIPIYDYVGDDADRKDVRRSKRARTQPLRYWKNERFLYSANKEVGILGEAMGNMPVPTKIVVANETPYKVRKIKSGNQGKAKGKKVKTDDGNGEEPFSAKKIKQKYAYLDGEDAFVWNDGREGPVEESEFHACQCRNMHRNCFSHPFLL
jgi:hypothetical protein